MLSKLYRIERNQVNYILKKGEGYVSKLFIIRYSKNNKGFNRYATVISKKIYIKAVPRNKLRRQIYEAIRLITQEIEPSQKQSDIVLIPKKKIINADFNAIKEDLRTIITNNG